MNKSKVIEGLEKLHATIYLAQGYLKHDVFEKSIELIKNICLESNYYLKHIKALEKASKKAKKTIEGTERKEKKRRSNTPKRIKRKRKV